MSFRLDRTAFHAGTHAQAEVYHRQHQPATMVGRLRAAFCLNSVVFDFGPDNPPRPDRTAFGCRAHAHRQHG